MAKEIVLTDIPEDQVQEVVDDFKSEGCTDVTKERQNNGLWTVRATCPEK